MTDVAGDRPPGPSGEEAGKTPPERMALDGRRPWPLDDRKRALQVIAGSIDIFALRTTEGRSTEARHHLFRVEAGGIILGLSPISDASTECLGIVAVGGQGAEVRVLARESISDLAPIERWATQLCASIVEPMDDLGVRQAEGGAKYELAAGQRLRAPSLGVAWISVDQGDIQLMGSGSACRASAPPLPVASGTWIESRAGASIAAFTGADLAPTDLWRAIDQFHALAMHCIARRIAAAADMEARQLVDRAKIDAAYAHRLVTDLAAVIVPRRDAVEHEGDAADLLLGACRIAVAAGGGSVVRPARRQSTRQEFNDIVDIARASRLRVRRTMLRADWWIGDVGPLVAWLGNARRPVAIVPIPGRGCMMVDPETGVRRRVDRLLASELASDAAAFYLPLPSRPLSPMDLLAYCIARARSDAARVLLSALGLGALTLTVPLITEVLFNSVLPRAELNQLMICVGALVAAAIGAACFQAVQGIAFLRIESSLDWTLQAAILDRLLRLPVSFFRQYTVGDLADRTLGIDAMRRVMTGHTIEGLLAGVFAFFSFALMFYYDARLALIAVGLTFLHAIVVIVTAAVRLYHERRHSDLRGKVEGLVLQLLLGVAKLRVAFGTVRALAAWARQFAGEKRHFVASQRAANVLEVFEAAFPAVATLIIFAAAGAHSAGKLTLDTGEFLAFYVAFGQSLAAMGEWATAIGETLIAVPHLSRIRPLIAQPLEMSAGAKAASELSGTLALDQVTFRYVPRGPPVLNKVALRVSTGEYVAIVGPSGAGKSTIFRLLLGFEKPEAGTICFDGKPIDMLDIDAVRRQIGVVLQNGKLTSGSLYENICGGAQVPLAQAWEAARLAGLDADIAAMPMGMHTGIAEGLSTLSGGQRQRLMIARALAHRPRIVLLDEATSALDNEAQAIVSASLAGLEATRVVIAHRLSTVQNADRILVLVNGEVVQSGSFEELIAAPGTFGELAKHQLL